MRRPPGMSVSCPWNSCRYTLTKSWERISVFNFPYSIFAFRGICLVACSLLVGCYETPSVTGTWTGRALPTTLYSVDGKTMYEGGSLQIVARPPAPDMLTKEQRQIVGRQMKPLLVDRQDRILDLSNISPKDLVQVTGCYRSLGGAEDYRDSDLSLVRWDRRTGSGFLVTSIEVERITDAHGRKVRLKYVTHGFEYPPPTSSRPAKPEHN